MVAAPVLAAVAALFEFTSRTNANQYITLTGQKSIAKWGTNRGTFQKLRENMPYLLGFSVLSRLLGVQKVTSSNLVGPTNLNPQKPNKINGSVRVRPSRLYAVFRHFTP